MLQPAVPACVQQYHSPNQALETNKPTEAPLKRGLTALLIFFVMVRHSFSPDVVFLFLLKPASCSGCGYALIIVSGFLF